MVRWDQSHEPRPEVAATGSGRDSRSPLELCVDATSFFAGLLADARRAHGLPAAAALDDYVVALLVNFAHPGSPREDDARPFTLLLDEALRAALPNRFVRLRDLGDRVLYTTGFFRAHLEQRNVELDYMEGLGARAYAAASAMLRARVVGIDEESTLDILGELADRFAEFAALLAETSDVLLARSAHSEAELLRVYERWLRTGSSALASALGQRGLTPRRNPGGLH